MNNRTQAIICDDLGMTQYVINNDQTVRERIDNVRNKVKDKADIIEGLSVVHRVRKKRGHVIFNYNSRIPWSIFIIFIPLETGMNTPQLHVIYLLKIFMTS